jgi:hypothetical protein
MKEIDTTPKRLVIECNMLDLVLLREGCCQSFRTASAFQRSMKPPYPPPIPSRQTFQP